MTHHDDMRLLVTLAAIGRLRGVYRATRDRPAAGDFAATVTDLARRCGLPVPETTWTLDVKVSK